MKELLDLKNLVTAALEEIHPEFEKQQVEVNIQDLPSVLQIPQCVNWSFRIFYLTRCSSPPVGRWQRWK
jgi:hypothetical protein